VSSLKATTQFLNNISSNELVIKITPLAEFILDGLIYVLKNDVDILKIVLEAIIFLTENHANFKKKKFEVLIEILCQIARENSFGRELALEFAYLLAKKSPEFIRKSNTFSCQFIPLLFELLLEIDYDNEIEKWTKEAEDNECREETEDIEWREETEDN